MWENGADFTGPPTLRHKRGRGWDYISSRAIVAPEAEVVFFLLSFWELVAVTEYLAGFSKMAEAVRVLVRCRPMNERERKLECGVSIVSWTIRTYIGYGDYWQVFVSSSGMSEQWSFKNFHIPTHVMDSCGVSLHAHAHEWSFILVQGFSGRLSVNCLRMRCKWTLTRTYWTHGLDQV